MHNAHVESCDSRSGPNPTPSYYSVQFHVYRLLIAPSIIDNLIAIDEMLSFTFSDFCELSEKNL